MDTDKSDVADQGHRYSVEEAEVLSEFTKRQVSKWRRRLQEPEKYRAMLYGAVYAKAMGEKRGSALFVSEAQAQAGGIKRGNRRVTAFSQT